MEPSNAQGSARPWYQHRWPWLLMLPPLFSMIGGFTLLYRAVSTPNPLVVDDYATIAKHTERRLERDREAARQGLRGLLVVESDESARLAVNFSFESPPGDVPARLTLRLLHPTLEQLDRQVDMVPAGDGYRALVEDAAPSRYYVLVEPEDRRWRLTGEITGGGTLRLQPPADALAGMVPGS
jgi:hypothetical protein